MTLNTKRAKMPHVHVHLYNYFRVPNVTQYCSTSTRFQVIQDILRQVQRIISKGPWTLKVKGTPYTCYNYPHVQHSTLFHSTARLFWLINQAEVIEWIFSLPPPPFCTSYYSMTEILFVGTVVGDAVGSRVVFQEIFFFNFIHFFLFWAFSLTWDPMAAKISKRYSSYKSQAKAFKLLLTFLLNGLKNMFDFS